MSGIVISGNMMTVGALSYISEASAAAPPFTPAYKFNDKRNSMYLPTIAAWPLSPLAIVKA